MNWISLVVVVFLLSGCGYTPEIKQERISLRNGWETLILSSSNSNVNVNVNVSVKQSHSIDVVEVREWRGNRHPEQRADEVFETNCEVENFGRILYRTKRAGKVAYWRDGREIGGLGGKRYIPVFVKTWEWEAVREIRKDGKYVLHFWTRNTFFADAQVTLIGIEGNRSDGREVKRTFQLKREKSLGNSWEDQMIVPGNFCIMELIVKPKGKKAIKFLAYRQVRGGGRVNILLSSCPLPETYTRPRVTISQDSKVESRVWPATFRAPNNIPAAFR